LYSDKDIYGRGYIHIPVVNWSGPLVKKDEVEDKKMLVKRFQIICKCVDVDESWSYMRRADFDLDQAVLEYTEDIQWEAENPFQGIPRHPCTPVAQPFVDRRPKNSGIFSMFKRSSTYNMLTFSKTKKHPSASAAPPVSLKDTDAASISSDSTVKSWKRLLTRNRTF